MAEKKPLYKRTWFIVVVAILFLSGLGNALTLSGPSATETEIAQDPVAASPTPTEVAEVVQTPTPATSESAGPLSDPNSEESIAYFAFSSLGQFKDMDKDIDDGIFRAKADQRIRLLGNVLELTFNLGQLKSLEPPTLISKSWASGMGKLEASIDLASDIGTNFSSGEASTSQMVEALEKVRGQLSALADVVAKIK